MGPNYDYSTLLLIAMPDWMKEGEYLFHLQSQAQPWQYDAFDGVVLLHTTLEKIVLLMAGWITKTMDTTKYEEKHYFIWQGTKDETRFEIQQENQFEMKIAC